MKCRVTRKLHHPRTAAAATLPIDISPPSPFVFLLSYYYYLLSSVRSAAVVDDVSPRRLSGVVWRCKNHAIYVNNNIELL